jgi:hypothetical protein
MHWFALALEQELENVKSATRHWQTEAERKIRAGQSRAEQAAQRAAEAESEALAHQQSLDELHRSEANRRELSDRYYRLRQAVRMTLVQLHHARHRAEQRQQLSETGQSESNQYIASLLDLAPEELQDIMQTVHPSTSSGMCDGLEGGKGGVLTYASRCACSGAAAASSSSSVLVVADPRADGRLRPPSRLTAPRRC